MVAFVAEYYRGAISTETDELLAVKKIAWNFFEIRPSFPLPSYHPGVIDTPRETSSQLTVTKWTSYSRTWRLAHDIHISIGLERKLPCCCHPLLASSHKSRSKLRISAARREDGLVRRANAKGIQQISRCLSINQFKHSVDEKGVVLRCNRWLKFSFAAPFYSFIGKKGKNKFQFMNRSAFNAS